MRRVGWFLLVVGGSIAGLWVVLLVTGQVPEVDEGRVDIWFHLVAEFGAASLLVAAGLAVLRGTPRAMLLAGGAVGALAYTAINSAGYYAEAGDWPPVVMFALVTAATALVGLRLAASFPAVRRGSEVADRGTRQEEMGLQPAGEVSGDDGAWLDADLR